MKIVARVTKVSENQYLFDGKLYDSFWAARREMLTKVRRLKNNDPPAASGPSESGPVKTQ